ncbi:MAG: hypothetical protein QF721_07355 [Verrucomicrobiota bacterium]|jgi:hypothetical protein|nr:hypothetical protein [Verrucomicrobiota bacterium]MDP7049252.1 hypothetical protein [Verrucomicrobiota bacterium]
MEFSTHHLRPSACHQAVFFAETALKAAGDNCLSLIFPIQKGHEPNHFTSIAVELPTGALSYPKEEIKR